MRSFGVNDEPLCATSEKGETFYSKEEMLPISLDIGRRILELFGYQKISAIVFRLHATAEEVHSVINGNELPSVELLLAISETTGASIDWLLTGRGAKFLRGEPGAAQHSTIRPLRPRARVSVIRQLIKHGHQVR